MELEFSGKVAIVTGASSGFGKGTAIKLASLGAKVTLCGRSPDRLKLVLDKVVSVSGRGQDDFLVVQGDLNDHSVREQIVERTIQKFKQVDILVANAGMLGSFQSISTATEESYNEVMDTNVKAMFFIIKQAAPHLEKTKGCIVTTSSQVSEMCVPDLSVYCMSQIAVDQLTRCAAVELGPKGVRVNSVNPGHVPTNLLKSQGFPDIAIDIITESEKRHQALSDRVATPEDVAELVVFLVSDKARFITGDNIRVDGGRTLKGPISYTIPTIYKTTKCNSGI